MTNFKRVLAACLMAAMAAGVSTTAHATDYTVSGVPHLMFTSTLGRTTGYDRVTLTGITNVTAPTCGVEKFDGSLIGIWVGAADRSWELLLAAKQAGATVTMRISDTQKDAAGHCALVWMYM